MGLRAAFIRQKMHVLLTQVASTQSSGLFAQPMSSRNYSHSWAIGPEFGVHANYLFSNHWRIEADCAGSLLSTYFTKISHKEDPQSVAVAEFNNFVPFSIAQHNIYKLCPTVEMSLGLGWGLYLCNQGYHIDFLANYEFKHFWNENAMRGMLDGFFVGTEGNYGNLFLQGLTITGRFDF